MGKIKNKNFNRKHQNTMQFKLLLALFATTQAVKLNQRKPVHKTNFLAQLVQPSADDIMAMFDTDGDGKITKEEFGNTLEALAKEHGYDPTPEEIAEAEAEFDKADADGSGAVDMNELKAALENM